MKVRWTGERWGSGSCYGRQRDVFGIESNVKLGLDICGVEFSGFNEM